MKTLFLIVVFVSLAYSTTLSKDEALNQLLSAMDINEFHGIWDKGIWKMVYTNSVADMALAFHKIADIEYYKYQQPYGVEDPILLDKQKIACTFHLIANITKVDSFEIDPQTIKTMIEVITILTEALTDIYKRTHPKPNQTEHERLPVLQESEIFSNFFGGSILHELNFFSHFIGGNKTNMVLKRLFVYYILPIIYNVTVTACLEPVFEEAKGLNSTEKLCQRFFPTSVNGPPDVQSVLSVLHEALEGAESMVEKNKLHLAAIAKKVLTTFLTHFFDQPNGGFNTSV